MLTPGSPPPPGQRLIASNVLGVAAASVTFSSIPQNFNHLSVVLVARSSGVVTLDNCDIQFNGDTTANYDESLMLGQSGTPSASATFGTTSALVGNVTGASSTAGEPAMYVVQIPNYTGTTFRKIATSTGGEIDPSAGTPQLGVLLQKWRSTAAITAIKLFLGSGSNFIAGSGFWLYGIK